MDSAEGLLWNAEAFEKLIKYQTYMDDLRALQEDNGSLSLAA
jgi:hypothetical protein